MTNHEIKNIIDAIGNTPLIPIIIPETIPGLFSSLLKKPKVKVYAKAEYYNPGGSVKDRPVKAMIQAALKEGSLKNKTLIDATSGNTGIAYAMLGSYLKIPIELALPENASPERKKILELYGVKIHYTSKFEGTDGAQKFVKDLVSRNSENYYYPDQYNNEHNWQAHYNTTGPEIWEQTHGKVTHFCTGIGTSGTFIGTSRFLKSKNVQCYQILPDNPLHGLEGWKHLETAMVPGIYDASVADRTIEVSTEGAFSFAVYAARHMGLLISPSAAANIYVALQLALEIDEGCIVTVLPDNAMKYLNDHFWKDEAYQKLIN